MREAILLKDSLSSFRDNLKFHGFEITEIMKTLYSKTRMIPQDNFFQDGSVHYSASVPAECFPFSILNSTSIHFCKEILSLSHIFQSSFRVSNIHC